MAVDDEQNILGHIHAHHTVHHFCHAPERHIVNEQQVQIGLPCLHRLVDLFFQESGGKTGDGVPGVFHLGQGVV